jgi:hypothetical protein
MSLPFVGLKAQYSLLKRDINVRIAAAVGG